MKKPVILHFINSLDRGGAETLLRDTVLELTDYHHVICYLCSPDILAGELTGCKLYKLDHTSWSQSWQTIKKMKRIIKEEQPQIIHSNLFDVTLLARMAAPRSVPFLFTIHNVMSKDAFEENRLSKISESITYKKHHQLIAVSEEALKDYDQWIGIKGKSTVLYNYVNQKFFDLHYNYTQDLANGFKLVAVGNLRRQKNYSLLLEAFKLLKDVPVSLHIYGGGELENELKHKISEEGLNVRLMGRAGDISTVLPNYHAYIMASLFEGFGIAPMEAMAAGMPLILSDLQVFREIAEDVPYYFDPVTPASIADAIQFAANNWQLMKEGAKRGKDIVRQKASKEIYFKKLLEIYKHAGN